MTLMKVKEVQQGLPREGILLYMAKACKLLVYGLMVHQLGLFVSDKKLFLWRKVQFGYKCQFENTHYLHL